MKMDHLFYAAGDDLYNTVRLGITFTEPVRPDILADALAQAAERFPFFSVKLVRKGECYELEHNDAPFVISPNGQTVTLGTEESGYHLFAFAYDGNRMYVDFIHFLSDGQGSFLFLKTILYCYLHRLYPEEAFDTSAFALPGSKYLPGEDEESPYPDELLPESPLGSLGRPEEIFQLSDQPQGYAHMDEWTSFRFHICQKDMVTHMSSVDGSPTTFIASLLYRAIADLHPENHLPQVCAVQHSFRRALRKPYSHHCHINFVPLVFPDGLHDKDTERINTIMRGAIILRADDDNDVLTVNEHIRNAQRIQGMTLDEKHAFMQEVVRRGIGTNTFEVSYTGRIPWSGLDKYITDYAPYLDLTLSGGITIEVFSRGTSFDINIMQRSPEPKYVDRFHELLAESGVSFERFPAEHFRLCSFRMPE